MNYPLRYTDPSGHTICVIGQFPCKNPIQFKPINLGDSGNGIVDWVRNTIVNVGCGILGGWCEVESNVLQPTGDASYTEASFTSAAFGMVMPLKPTSALEAASKLVKGGISADKAAGLANTIAKDSTHGLRSGGWTTGDVVSLGHWRPVGEQPGYIDWAKANEGTIWFDMPQDVFETLKQTKGLTWEINERFLDQAIEGGAQFRLQIPNPDPNTGFGREIQYLTEKGFRKVNEGGEWWMKQ